MQDEPHESDYEYKCPRCLHPVARERIGSGLFYCSPQCGRKFTRENGPRAVRNFKKRLAEALVLQSPAPKIDDDPNSYRREVKEANENRRKIRGKDKTPASAHIAINVARDTTERIHAIQVLGRREYYEALKEPGGGLLYYSRQDRLLPPPPGQVYEIIGPKTLRSRSPRTGEDDTSEPGTGEGRTAHQQPEQDTPAGPKRPDS